MKTDTGVVAAPKPTPPQVKVMRLALTKAGPLNTAAAARGSLLTLPTVFETIYAGQSLKCLARVLNAPRGCRVFARLEHKGHSSADAGSVQGEGILDLLVKGRLLTHGPHELVLVCASHANVELLKKVYKIDVSQSFVLEGAPHVTFVEDKVFVRFVVKNAAKDMMARLTRVEFLCEKFIKMTPVTYPDESRSDCLFIAPEEVHSFVFMLKLDKDFPPPPTDLGRLRMTWNLGLGEECELFFPQLRLDNLPFNQSRRQLSMEDPSKTRWMVGEPIPIHLSPSSEKDVSSEQDTSGVSGLLIHGPKSVTVGGRAFLYPTRPGVISDISKVYGLKEKLPIFVISRDQAAQDGVVQESAASIPLVQSLARSASSDSALTRKQAAIPMPEEFSGFEDDASYTQALPLAVGRTDAIGVSLRDKGADSLEHEESRERTLSEEMAQELGLADTSEAGANLNAQEEDDLDVTAELEKELGGV